VPDSAAANDSRRLLRFACAELKQQLLAGRPATAEAFLAKHPALASDPDLALALVRAEWQLRRELGPPPSLEEYCARFPAWSDRLHDLLGGTATAPGAAAPADTVAYAPPGPPGPGGVSLPGRYALQGELDHGGMGVVYRAHDAWLERDVALKVIRAGAEARPEEVERFFREARAAAALDHPNIVRILDIGTAAGCPYYTMALAPGGSLKRHAGRYAEPRAAAALVERVARAVGAAHARGVVHRDLKPSNILLGENGEPLVADFGLAKLAGAATRMTRTGRVLGTPAYMAPEQAAGRSADVTPAADVWALGVVLYELVTSRLPYDVTTADAAATRARFPAPVPPRLLRPEIPFELETVILACLRREPGERYLTGTALADDLRRWLDGRPVEARPEPWAARLGRALAGWSRGRVAALFVGVAALGLLVPLLSAPAPAPRPPEDPEGVRAREARDRLLEDRAAGRSVTLVGPTGPPKWYRWRNAEGRGRLPQTPGAPLILTGYREMTLLELLPDPGSDRYRLRAEVKARNSAFNGYHAGLFFCADEIPAPAGPLHRFHLFTLDCPRRNRWAWVSAGYDQPPGGAGEAVPLVGHGVHYLKGSPAPRPACLPALAVGAGGIPWGAAVALSPAAVYDEHAWHELVVDVTPAAILARWDGRPLPPVPRDWADHWVRRDWLTDNRFGPPPEFPRRGPLGLFVGQGEAAFRNVAVDPLPEPL
jgi:serine/threonine-protein kinase